MSLAQDWENTHAKLVTLLAINIFQPVKLSLLKQKLNTQIDTSKLKIILDELIKEKKLNRELRHYRLTYKGLNSVVPGKGRVLRDLHRMEYLVNLSKGGGDNVSGR